MRAYTGKGVSRCSADSLVRRRVGDVLALLAVVEEEKGVVRVRLRVPVIKLRNDETGTVQNIFPGRAELEAKARVLGCDSRRHGPEAERERET